MNVQTSKTKRTFAELQEKVLRDATAGSMANPLRISGASLAGKIKPGSCLTSAMLILSSLLFVIATLWVQL